MIAPIAVRVDQPPLALLADRNDDTRQMYAEYLRQAACNVDEAEDGREALAKALSRRPDVIVTETRLPGIDGFDLCTLLRQDRTTREIPIVVVTADAFEVDIKRAQDAGADAVLVKPCLPESLAQTVRELLHAARALRRHVDRVRADSAEQLAWARVVVERAQATTAGRRARRTAHHQHSTTTPPSLPPALTCPTCERPLDYKRSHVGGVSVREQEQWDYFECQKGCGTFQFRQRTRKLRRV